MKEPMDKPSGGKPALIDIILAKKKSGPEKEPDKMDPDEASEDDSYDMSMEAASDDVFAALKSGNKAEFKSALMNFVEMCKSEA